MPKKRQQPAPQPPLVDIPKQTGHARARLTVDSQNQVSLGGFVFSTVPSPDYEQEWRTNLLDDRTLDRITTADLLIRLADLSPEISRALWDFLRFCNAGWEVKALRVGTEKEVEDKRAAAAIDLFLDQLKTLYGSADVVFNRLFISAFLRGALCAELVLDAAGRLPVDIATPDPNSILFERQNDPVRGPIFVPYQQKGSQKVFLDRETFRYVPVDPVPGSPYGRALASPAVATTLFSLSLLRDLKRVVQQQGYPRPDITIVTENLAKWMPPALREDPAEKKRWLDKMIADVKRDYEALAPESAFIHTDSFTFGRPVGTIDSSSLGAVDGLMRALERNMVRALKSSPFLFALSESTTETQANRQYEAFQSAIQAVQHLAEHLIEYLLNLALQAQGMLARVKFRFAVVRASELLRDLQAEQLKTQIAALRYALGYIDQKEAAAYGADKEEPALPEPLALPNTLTPFGEAAAADSGLDTVAPTAAQDGEDTTSGRQQAARLLADSEWDEHGLVWPGNGNGNGHKVPA